MSNVVSLKKPEERPDPHGCGDARCLQCGHEWVAVSPIGLEWITCPECKTQKGTWQLTFHFHEGTLYRVCTCGCDLFLLSPDGHMCAKCGTFQRYD